MTARKPDRVILVNPPPDYNLELHKSLDISRGVSSPLGLLLLATVLKENGFSTRIIDGQTCDCRSEIMKELENDDILCLGFSVMSSQYMIAAQLSREVKRKNDKIPIVWGGFHPTILPEQTIRNDFCDFLIRGEGDKAFLLFCRFLRDGGDVSEVPNLIYLDGEKVIKNELAPLSTFDELPNLDWNMADNVEYYVIKKDDMGYPTRKMNILAGLGCNYRCTFCHNAIFRKKHRKRNAEDIVAEMNWLHEKFDITEFWLGDEDFFTDKKRTYEFLELLENNTYKFKWSANIRGNYVRENYVNKELIGRIAAAGCYFLSIGAECGTDYMLKKIKKGITVEHILRFAEWTKDFDLHIVWSFIVGIPGESCEMTLETLRVIEKVKEINPKSILVGPHVFRPYPGSPLYNEALTMGLEEPRDWNQAEAFLRSLFQFRQISEEAIPWHDEPRKFKYIILSYGLMNITRITLLRRMALFILKPLTKYRLRTGNYSLLVEKPILDYMNRIYT